MMRPFRRALFLGALLVAGAALLHLDWIRIAGYLSLTRRGAEEATGRGLDLAAYRAVMQAQPVAGLRRNASGLTWNMATGTLFAVVNRPPAVVEMTPDGRLLRQIPLPGMADTEGISHVQDDLFVVSDESDNSLHWIRIAANADVVIPVARFHPVPGFRPWPNLGFEGASWDETRTELLLVNEKWPQQVMIVSGLDPASPQKIAVGYRPDDDVRVWRPRAWLGPLGRDLASLTVVPDSGYLLLLSEASALVTEYSRDGAVVGLLPLWGGTSGLRRTVPQPEGITLGPDGSIYILSEPNLLYRFVRTDRLRPKPLMVPAHADVRPTRLTQVRPPALFR